MEFNRKLDELKKSYGTTYQDVKFNQAGIITQIVEKKKAENEFITYQDLDTDFSYLYHLLEDEESKKNLIKVALYYSRANYPVTVIDKDFYNSQMDEITRKGREFYNIDLNLGNAIIDLSPFGYDFKLLTDSYVLFCLILNNQYEIKRIGFEVKHGDHVLDCGACAGETSIYFANKVGETGKIFAFEAVEENIKAFERNTEYNPRLQSRIQLIQNFVSDKEEDVFVIQNSAASRVVNEANDTTVRIHALMIDDFIKDNKINKVDFIKMDIEGSELKALMGAEETITKFRPKMAICLYHKISDYYDIPKYIKYLEPNYKFYLSVNHPIAAEVVLHCVPISY
jgi:FkbM family methyltransferase